MTYNVTLRSGKQSKIIAVSAGNYDKAVSLALDEAASISKETGAIWKIARCDPA